MNPNYLTYLFMGVAGSGKTTIAKKFSKKINAFVIEGDDFHSSENINKMSSGIPLNDEDRYEWLVKIKNEIQSRQKTQNVVVTCSALKKKYRLILEVDNYKLVYLKISKATARKRIRSRLNHFMPDSLIDSQFAILEEPINGLTLNENLSPNEMIKELTSHFQKEIL